MDSSKFNHALQLKTLELRQYVRNEFPVMAARKAIRFVNGNFRAQGWQGSSFQAWPGISRKGRILIRTGRLRRGTLSETGPYAARIYNAVPYARFHNRGFKGTVTVRAHTRNSYNAVKVGTGRFTKAGNERTRTVHQIAGSHQVRAHTRNVDNKQRQFMPYDGSESPVLNESIRRDLIKSIKNIFN